MGDRTIRTATKVLASLINSRHEYNKAQMDFKKELLLSKIKQRAEVESKKELMPLELEQKRAIMPYELEQKRQEAQIQRTAPLSQKDIIYSNISKISEEQWSPMQKRFMENYMGGSEQEVVDPTTGQTLFTMPKGSRFKPTTGKPTAASQKMDYLKSLRNSFLSGEISRDDVFSQLQEFDPTMDISKAGPMVMTWEMEKRKRPQATPRGNQGLDDKIQKAKAAGYTDEEINAYLGQ